MPGQIGSSEPTSRFFTSQRQRLHYADWGNADAPPLILLHGGRDHCRSWDWAAAELRSDWHIIAPDLRGHGDSGWSPDGVYTSEPFIYDLAELIHQLGLAPVSIVAHSLGGNISLRYAGIYPENVRKIVAIEGLGPSPAVLAERERTAPADHMRNWIEGRRRIAALRPRRYARFEDALARMREQNAHLSEERAEHLTRHGLRRNDDGSWSWKFDIYAHSMRLVDDLRQPTDLWNRIACPTLLIYGADSWASNPAVDGRAAHFRNVRVALIEDAGHWVHHDQHEAVMAEVRAFL